MGTLLRVGWINLRRDRVAQALTFLLPIIFFSIFATVFGGRGDSQTARIRVAIVDEDRSELSRRVIEGLKKESGLRVRTTSEEEEKGAPLDRATGQRLVRAGDVPVAVVIPSGLGAAFGQSGFGSSPPIQLLADPSDPVAPQMVGGLLQKVTMTAAPDLMMQGGIRQFEAHAGQLTPQQRAAVDAWIPMLKSGTAGGGSGNAAMGLNVQVVDVMRTDDRRGSLISFYAAGIGVMFLLFSMVGAAGSVLLEEAESGTLERLLCTNIGMPGILLGKWAFLLARRRRPADGDVSVGADRIRAAVVLARAGVRRHDRHHRRGRGRARPAAGDHRTVARAVVGLFDDSHPDDVRAWRQHVPPLPHERDDAEGRAGDVQRLGARRLPQGVLAQRGAVGAVAAAPGAGRSDSRVSRGGADVCQAMGNGVTIVDWRRRRSDEGLLGKIH